MQVFRTLFWGETHLSQRCVRWDWSFICWRLLLGPNGKAWGCLSSPSFLGFVYNLCLREGEHVRLPIRPFKLWPFRLAEVVEPRGPLQNLCVPTSPCSLPPCSHTSTQSRKSRLGKKKGWPNGRTNWEVKTPYPLGNEARLLSCLVPCRSTWGPNSTLCQPSSHGGD